jgi:1,4-dihydroxy-2-naphthoate octaprenyltransferase
MNRRRAWALAARVSTLPAAVAPVVVGSAAAAHDGRFEWIGAAGALIVSLAIQIGTNFSNDAFDFLRGADTSRRLGPPRVTQAGLLPARVVLAGAYLCFGLAAVVGAYFVAQYGWPILIAGLLSIASGLAYTAGPWPIAYHALGEVFVFVFFGLVAVVGTTFVQTGHVTPLALGAAVPVGLLCTAILIVNNLRDIETDRAAGKRTLAVMLGPRSTRSVSACYRGRGPGDAARGGVVGSSLAAAVLPGWWSSPVVRRGRPGVERALKDGRLPDLRAATGGEPLWVLPHARLAATVNSRPIAQRAGRQLCSVICPSVRSRRQSLTGRAWARAPGSRSCWATGSRSRCWSTPSPGCAL